MPVRDRRQDRGARQAPAGTVRASSRILDTAFRTAYRVSAHGSNPLDRARRRALLKVVRAGSTAMRHLGLAARPFRRRPPEPFGMALVEQRFGAGRLGRSITRLRRAEERIRRISREEQRTIARASTSEQLAESVRRFYGRLASLLREVDVDLDALREIGAFLKERPEISAGVPCVVIAGFPNVGKSSLVASLSTARPKVAPYPFTTVAVAVGHTDLGFDRLQVVDTPGVLGRPGQVNAPEAEATTAVRRAANVVLFVVDPSESCGYPLAEQERLLERWRQEFPELTILAVAAKADLPHPATAYLEVSAMTGLGLPELRRLIEAAVTARRPASDSSESAEPAPSLK